MTRFAALAFVVSVFAGCTSTQVPLGGKGALCDFDDQCDPGQGLGCVCIVVKNPDDEGPDQIVAHGHCDVKGVLCPGHDAGPDATETGADASDASDAADSNVMDANDAGDSNASDATDAADAVSTDADAASG
jgi:hypothetical protein